MRIDSHWWHMNCRLGLAAALAPRVQEEIMAYMKGIEAEEAGWFYGRTRYSRRIRRKLWRIAAPQV